MLGGKECACLDLVKYRWLALITMIGLGQVQALFQIRIAKLQLLADG
jgi:hypothetical protein